MNLKNETWDHNTYHCINGKVARFYNANLLTRNNKGMAYLQQLGLNKDIISSFMIGYAPANGHELINYLKGEGVSPEDIQYLGLAKEGKDGLLDMFRDRVMFPIINTEDEVIAFSGVAIEDVSPKYTTVWRNEMPIGKTTLFGLNLTKKMIEKEDRAIIVEGVTDLLLLYQNGIRNVAAVTGMTMSDDQAKLLCNFSRNIVLSYDFDSAGNNAALRDAETIVTAGGNPYIMRLRSSKDTAEFIKTHGKDAFISLVNDATKTICNANDLV